MELQKTIRASVGIDRVKSMQGAEKYVGSCIWEDILMSG